MSVVIILRWVVHYVGGTPVRWWVLRIVVVVGVLWRGDVIGIVVLAVSHVVVAIEYLKLSGQGSVSSQGRW